MPRSNALLELPLPVSRAKEPVPISGSRGEHLDLFENAYDIVYTHDLRGRFTWINNAIQQVTGYTREEALRMNVAELWSPESLEQAWRFMLKQLGGGERATHEITIRTKDGRSVVLEVNSRLLFDAGQPVGVLGIARDVSERRQSEAHLRLLKSVVVNANDAVLIAEHNEADPAGSRIVYINDAFTRMTGYAPEETLGETSRILWGPEAEAAQVEQVCQALAAGVTLRVEMVNRRKDGSEYWADVNFVPITDEHGRRTHWVAVQRETTHRKRAEDLERDRTRILEMVARNEPLESIMTHLARMVERQCPHAVCSVHLHRHGQLYPVALPGPCPCDPAVANGLAISQAPNGQVNGRSHDGGVQGEAAVGASWIGASHLSHGDDCSAGWSVPIFSAIGTILGVFAIHYRSPRRPSDAEIELLEKASRLAAIAIEQRQLTDRLAHQAQHDMLTGLPNRGLFEARLEEALVEARQQGTMLAVLFVDLDRFKQINDTLGHSVGDLLLQQVAKRLATCVRRTDMLARMGGDEFTLLLTGLENQQYAVRVAQKLLDALKAPFAVDKYELFVTASVGISIHPRDGKDAATLHRNADSAMYRAKNLGKNNFQLFVPEIHITAFESLEMENALRKALENGELHVHYQPQVDTGGKLTAVEALLLWNHPKLGPLSPAQFIPVAEESGLIFPIGNWVLRQACRQNAAWLKAGYTPVKVAVNVSALQFTRAGFVDTAARALAENGLSPSLLELELTESMVMRDVEESTRQMQGLRSLGIGLAIDDFGTGYSSLSYLRRFPINTLKIDQSFLRELDTEPNTIALINAIVALAHSLRLCVIAEGVETERQHQALLEAGCDRFQGYLFGPPVPAEAAARLLSRPGLPLRAPAASSAQRRPHWQARPISLTGRANLAVN
jgi:diguanylate cyclase (GGDEF)-like protein/PAS domain S-box-containing protein